MVSPDYVFFYKKRAVWSAHYNLQGLDSERKLGELGAVLKIEPVRIFVETLENDCFAEIDLEGSYLFILIHTFLSGKA